MTGGRRLSDLPDDLLRRILYFAPAKEAASTSALARRWRTLWLSSGAVNLDSRSYDRTLGADFGFPKSDAFLRDAGTALAPAADRHRCRFPVRKLTFRVETAAQDTATRMFLNYREDLSRRDMVGAVLSLPAARRVEELCVEAYSFHLFSSGDDDDTAGGEGGHYMLSIISLPSENLRVLRITNCCDLTPPYPPGSAVVAFPRLAELRLHSCSTMWLEDLQSIIDTAPWLAILDLRSVNLSSRYNDDSDPETHDGSPPPPVSCARLRCPAVTALVLWNCTWTNRSHVQQIGMELDAPMLQCFTYKGYYSVQLKSQAPNLTRVDIHFFDDAYDRADELCAPFWQCVQSFSNTKILRLRVNYLEDIAVIGEKKIELLGNTVFHDLDRLEVEALYEPGREAAAVAIANFLHCCPMVRVLRLKLSMVRRDSYQITLCQQFFLDSKDQSDFSRSIDHFLRRRLKPMISYEVSDIPGLSGQSFNCLQISLRSVSLQFRMEKSNCFGVRLAKFFAENAMVLEEIYIDSGNQKMREHINHRVGIWAANSSKSKDWSGTTCFAVLPLERST